MEFFLLTMINLVESKMYKYLSMVLFFGLLTMGGFYLYQRNVNSKVRKELNNKIAAIEGTIKETETAYSVRGLQLDDLKSDNDELQQKIKDRDEKIFSLSEVNLKLKNQVFKLINSSQDTVVENGKQRVRVQFNTTLKDSDYLKVYGYTLTDPAYAEVSLEWLRDLKLNFVLTKNKDDTYRLYVDSGTSDIVPSKVTLKVDPSLFDTKWYERMAVGTDILIGPHILSSLKLTYDIDKFYIGPVVMIGYDKSSIYKFYGMSAGYYPFR